jgi:3-phenylpropionate/trans-cinnamate dioxygenase ferredoxin subunit
MAPTEVARLTDLAPSIPTIVRAGERELVLVRDGTAVYALRNSCPHMDASFHGAAVIPRVSGTPQEPSFDDRQPVIACPWHQYEFSLATGRCLTSERLSVRTYPVTVCGGKVLVDLIGHAR